MKLSETAIPIGLIFFSFIVAALFIYIASVRVLTPLEGILLQAFALCVGLLGSFIFGRQSSHAAAQAIIKPHARSAFRRLMSLFKSLSRLASAIEEARISNLDDSRQIAVLDKLEAIVKEQIATADDALDDWQDIVPEDVRELRSSVEGRKQNNE